MALGQIEKAIEALENETGPAGGPRPVEKAVHETRKSLKRLRALLRLLKEHLEEQTYARESTVLRDAARHLASARDAEVMVHTLDGLVGRQPRKLASRRGVKRLRAKLVVERDTAAEAMLADHLMRAHVLDELRAMRVRVSTWELADPDGIEAIEPALKRLYAKGRARMHRAERARGDRTRAMHLWRKRVKDLRYAAEILDRPNERVGKGRKRKQAHKSDEAVHLGKVAARADNLGEILGEEHDLALLAERVRAEAKADRASRVIGAHTRKILLKAIVQRRKRLRKRALRDGKSLYGRTPEKFVQRVRRVYAHTSRV
jgi:hypothetical protein